MPKGVYKKNKDKKPWVSLRNALSHYNLGKHWKQSPEARLHRKGINKRNHLWKGGISQKNRSERENLMNTIEYRLWRDAVYERDNYTCLWCGARNGHGKTVVLNADHIQTWKEHPELRFAIDNGRTLCVQCHKLRHKEILQKNGIDEHTSGDSEGQPQV